MEFSNIMIKDKTTIAEHLLTPHAYKIIRWIALCEFVIVLILPWFKLMDLSIGALGCHSLTLMDLLTEFFQRHHINFFISLFLGAILTLIVCVIFLAYIIWASGNMYFEK